MSDAKPIDMLLFCPKCGDQHVDQPQPEKNWSNPPHRSHECQACGYVWRPADVPTNGVVAIQTKGQRDSDPKPKTAAMRALLENALPIIETEAEMREGANMAGGTDLYYTEMRDLANEIEALLRSPD